MSPELQLKTASQAAADLDIKKLVHPFSLLLNALTKLENDSSASTIHATRTAVRKVESILKVLDAGRGHAELLRSVSRLRKRAGKVRDFDVMLSMVASLPSENLSAPEADCREQLVRCLERQRKHRLRKLDHSLKRHKSHISSGVKQYSRKVKRFSRSANSPGEKPDPHKRLHDRWNVAVAAREAQLLRELAEAPFQSLRQDHEQLHLYRRKVRELRVLLRLHQKYDGEFADCLGEAKDAIGLWHDWALLHPIAMCKLGPECETIRLIGAAETERLDQAMLSVTRLQREYLGPSQNQIESSDHRATSGHPSLTEGKLSSTEPLPTHQPS